MENQDERSLMYRVLVMNAPVGLERAPNQMHNFQHCRVKVNSFKPDSSMLDVVKMGTDVPGTYAVLHMN